MKKIAMTVLCIAALGFSAAPALANQYIDYLARTSCQESNSSKRFIDGCRAYIEHRIQNASSPEAALSVCKGATKCKSSGKEGSKDQQTCFDGCEYLYDMGR